MDEITEVIEYGTFMRAAAEAIVAHKGGHGCVNDYERMLRDYYDEDEYYELAQMNCDCANLGGTWYPHLWPNTQVQRDFGIVMPIVDR